MGPCLARRLAVYSCVYQLDTAGLGRGGQQLQSCRKAYLSAVELLVQLANLQVSSRAAGGLAAAGGCGTAGDAWKAVVLRAGFVVLG